MNISEINRRTHAAWALVASEKYTEAIAEARALLLGVVGHDAVHDMNCAGILVDAGGRLGDAIVIQEGTGIFEAIDPTTLSPDLRDEWKYGLANGKGYLLRGNAPEPPDWQVRDMGPEEEVVALYYESTDNLRTAKSEVIINCATLLISEGSFYEAADLLGHAVAMYPPHPNAHLHSGSALFRTFMSIRGQDSMVHSLVAPAVAHYDRAVLGFEAHAMEDFAANARSGLAQVTAAVRHVCGPGIDHEIAKVINQRLDTPRCGAPLGLDFLARSPYRAEDDPLLLDPVPDALRHIVADAAATFVVGRTLMQQSARARTKMPKWGAHSPKGSEHLRYAAVRQLSSVLDKVAWLINEAFAVGLSEDGCSFAALFAPPDKSKPTPRFRPQLLVSNPGLMALAGMSCAFGSRKSKTVYAPLKVLRNVIEHRVPTRPITKDDVAFLQGIARAAILHAVDAVVHKVHVTDKTIA
jgi:hypothetical protein